MVNYQDFTCTPLQVQWILEIVLGLINAIWVLKKAIEIIFFCVPISFHFQVFILSCCVQHYSYSCDWAQVSPIEPRESIYMWKFNLHVETQIWKYIYMTYMDSACENYRRTGMTHNHY